MQFETWIERVDFSELFVAKAKKLFVEFGVISRYRVGIYLIRSRDLFNGGVQHLFHFLQQKQYTMSWVNTIVHATNVRRSGFGWRKRSLSTCDLLHNWCIVFSTRVWCVRPNVRRISFCSFFQSKNGLDHRVRPFCRHCCYLR